MILAFCRATGDERRRHLPGDELVPEPMGSITHAISIDAPPGAVWPWLAQLGAGRAGWYAYDHIDNGGRPSARRIIPGLQRVAAGDVLPALPGARDAFIVEEVNDGRALVLVVPRHVGARPSAAGSPAPSPRVSWALVLEPLAHGRTRLIARGRIAPTWLSPGAPASVSAGRPILIERVYGLLARAPRSLLPVAGFGHYLMESRMLRRIKRRAERRWAAERLSGGIRHRGATP